MKLVTALCATHTSMCQSVTEQEARKCIEKTISDRGQLFGKDQAVAPALPTASLDGKQTFAACSDGTRRFAQESGL